MTVINHKSISGVTSITAPAGSDNLFTVHTNDTTERFRIDASGHQNISGIITAANFKTGTSNLHNTGLNIFDLDVDGHTNLDNVSIAGVTTITGALHADGFSTVGGEIAINGTVPRIGFTDSNANSDFRIKVDGGSFQIEDITNSSADRFTINSSGNVSIAKDLDVDGHTNLDNVSIAGVSTFTGRIDASDNVAITSGNRLYFGNSDVAYVKGEHGGSGYLVLGANSDHVRLTRNGQIITGGASAISFNNVGNDAFGSFFEVNGTHTIDHHGVLGVSGRTNTNNARVGLIQFLNTENSNTSSTGNANSRSLGHISVYADTSDSNAGDDCGGRIVIGTKGEAAGMNDLLFLTSDKTVGIQAIPAVGDLNSTATGGAALSAPKLYVQDDGTNGKYNLMIRCNSGSDADNTGAAIALNHNNDRGILIEGGRWSGNRSWGAIKAIDNVGRVTDCIAIRGGNGAGVQDVRIYTGEAVSTTERLRIDNTGRLTLGESDFTASNDVHIKRANNGGDVALRITNNTSTNSGSTASLYFTTSPTQDFNTAYIKAKRDGGRLEFGYSTNPAAVIMHVSTGTNVGIARTINNVQYHNSGTPSNTGTAPRYNLSINREANNDYADALNRSLNVDNQYTVSTYRSSNANRNSISQWYDIAEFNGWDIDAKINVQSGGTFTGDQVEIRVISSYNSALNNGRSGPYLEVKSTQAHTGDRFTKVRIGCHNSNRRPIVQVYFDGSKTHNAHGHINVTVHDYGSAYGQGGHRADAKWTSPTTLNEVWRELLIVDSTTVGIIGHSISHKNNMLLDTDTNAVRINPPPSQGGSTVLHRQALIGTKHIYTAYHNFSSTNSNMNITSIRTNSCGELWVIGGWANGNGLRMKKYTWVASGDTSITEQFNQFASRYGVGITINTPTMSISGDYVHFNFTFSDNQGNKMEKLKIHFEYFHQFLVDS